LLPIHQISKQFPAESLTELTEEDMQFLRDLHFMKPAMLDDFVEDVIEYIAGYCVRRIVSRKHCGKCADVLSVGRNGNNA
jgi:hypothetical protein